MVVGGKDGLLVSHSGHMFLGVASGGLTSSLSNRLRIRASARSRCHRLSRSLRLSFLYATPAHILSGGSTPRQLGKTHLGFGLHQTSAIYLAWERLSALVPRGSEEYPARIRPRQWPLQPDIGMDTTSHNLQYVGHKCDA